MKQSVLEKWQLLDELIESTRPEFGDNRIGERDERILNHRGHENTMVKRGQRVATGPNVG